MSLSPIMFVHVCSGGVGLVSGTAAMAIRKGSRGHGVVGIVFSVAMLILGATGAYIGYTRSQVANIFGGLLTMYMIATAWRAGRRRNGRTGWFDWMAMLAGLAVGSSCLAYGWMVAHSPTGSKDGVPAGMNFFLGSVVLLAAAGDVRVLVRGGISGASRIARHLWRMCFGLFIASGSFFMGRQQIFPEFVRRSNVLILLTVLPLILLIFWMVRVLFRRRKTGGMVAKWEERAGVGEAAKPSVIAL